jgi:hypothetical protein
MRSADGLGSTESAPPALVAALRKILHPLIRLLLAHRLTFPFLSGLLKEIYVEVALGELAREARAQTDSRLSLMTGVHRKDVRRLRSALPFEESVPTTVSRGSQIALRWISERGYQDGDGAPLPLPRTSEDAREPSFNRLVESISKDIRPRAVLDDLLHLGVAQLDAQGRVLLRIEGFVPEEGFDEKAFYFGRSVRDHIASAAHNLLGERPPLFERCVYYEGLTAESVQELEELSGKLAMDVLRAVNRRGAALKRRDAARKERGFRVTLGAFFFRGQRDDVHEEP